MPEEILSLGPHMQCQDLGEMYEYDENIASFIRVSFTQFKSHSYLADVTAAHYIDVIMTTMASQITSLTIVYSTVYSDADQRKHQSSASLAFVWGIHRTDEFPAQRASYAENVFIDDVIMAELRGYLYIGTCYVRNNV